MRYEHGTETDPGKVTAGLRDPTEFFAAVRARFGEIAWDLAATERNKVVEHCITPERDSLSLAVRWHELCQTNPTSWLWLNPPFANIGRWAAKCDTESKKGARILLLVPAGVGSNWFRDYVHGVAYVLALNGRLCFDGKNPYPKDCMLCVYGETPGFDVWNWKQEWL